MSKILNNIIDIKGLNLKFLRNLSYQRRLEYEKLYIISTKVIRQTSKAGVTMACNKTLQIAEQVRKRGLKEPNSPISSLIGI